MTRRIIITLIILFTCGELKPEAQDYKAGILAFQECFNNMSQPKPHDGEYILSNGKRVVCMEQSDYSRSAFVSVDKLIYDLQRWAESPYLWEMKHRRNTTIMDKNDLKKWEIDNFQIIADSYFNNSRSTFHIAAHGLLDSYNNPANKIKIGGVELNAKETAELILLQMGEGYNIVMNARDESFTVVLHCCHTAEGENNFAKQLSEELHKYLRNVHVIASPDIVYATMDYDDNYTECVTTKSEYERVKKTGMMPKKYNWSTYHNGRETLYGHTDWRRSLKAIQASF